jgi:hypothetical protein
MSQPVETVRIVDPENEKDFLVVNAADYRENQKKPAKDRWKLYQEPAPETPAPQT